MCVHFHCGRRAVTIELKPRKRRRAENPVRDDERFITQEELEEMLRDASRAQREGVER